MRAGTIVLFVAACSPTTVAPAPLHNDPGHGGSVEQPTPVVQPTRLVDRTLRIGSLASHAVRTTWELSIDGDRATLVETDQEAPGSLTIEQADRETKWAVTRTHVENGPARHVGDHLALDLESTTDSLFLRCWQLPLVVATAGARRVPTPGRRGDCSDPGAWSPPSTMPVTALVCGQGEGLDDGQRDGLDGQRGSLDETLWRFAAPPGIEYVEQTDDCFQSTGLRLAK